MKTLYLDCQMGCAGDMFSAALYELLEDREGFIKKINSAGIKNVCVKPEPMKKCGILGTHMGVYVDGVAEEDAGHDHHDHDHDHVHVHAHMKDIEDIVDALAVPEKIKTDVKNIYKIIAEAESHAHGVPVTDIHFHEVGTMDAIADVTMACMLMDEIGPDRVIASDVHVGSGSVHCAHGILPVPAPATAYILQGIPFGAGDIKGELCTPTGAAILKYFVSSFEKMPVMTVERTGYGMGKKDFDKANCLRAFLGETKEEKDSIVELSFNVDDMTGEKIAFATGILFDAGARDVFTVPVGMKKSRPGTLICVLCDEQAEKEIVGLIFRHTSTLGIRRSVKERYTLEREMTVKETGFGDVRVKRSYGYGVKREKPEYDDIARIARENGISVYEAEESVNKNV